MINYSPKIVTSGLIFYMDPINTKSYSGSGVTWTNLVSGLTSSIFASASYNSSTKSFDTNATLITDYTGVNTQTITFADASEYTLDFWVKLRSGATNLNSLCGLGATTQWVLLNVTSTSNWFPRYRENSGVYNDFNPITNVNLVNWTNITLVIKSSRVVDFYLNGTFIESSLTTPSSTLLTINRVASGYSSGGNNYPLQGSISSTKFYNRKLTSIEILQNYTSLKSRFGL